MKIFIISDKLLGGFTEELTSRVKRLELECQDLREENQTTKSLYQENDDLRSQQQSVRSLIASSIVKFVDRK